MRQTLFHISDSIGGLPVFGFGLVAALWLAASVGAMAYLLKKQGWTRETQSYLPVLAVVGVVVVFVLPALIEEEGVPIRGYGVMLLLAVVSGVAMCAYRARRMGVNTDIIYSLAFWMFIGGMLGARLFYIIEYWPQFERKSVVDTIGAMVNVAQGGLVVYGSLIGAMIAFAAFVRRHRLPALALADLISPGMVLGLCLGRIGCLLNGCCYGGICEPPQFGSSWAMTFPWGSPPHEHQAEQGDLDFHGLRLPDDPRAPPRIEELVRYTVAGNSDLEVGDVIRSIRRPSDRAGGPVLTTAEARGYLERLSQPDGALEISIVGEESPHVLVLNSSLHRSRPIHPTQIYDSINAGLICLLLLAVYPYRTRDGQVIALMLTIYPITRFLIEIIRQDEAAVFGTGMSISQNVSIAVIVAIAVLWVYVLRSRQPLALPAV